MCKRLDIYRLYTYQSKTSIMTAWKSVCVLTSHLSPMPRCSHIQEAHADLHHIVSPLNLEDPKRKQAKQPKLMPKKFIPIEWEFTKKMHCKASRKWRKNN